MKQDITQKGGESPEDRVKKAEQACDNSALGGKERDTNESPSACKARKIADYEKEANEYEKAIAGP